MLFGPILVPSEDIFKTGQRVPFLQGMTTVVVLLEEAAHICKAFLNIEALPGLNMAQAIDRLQVRLR